MIAISIKQPWAGLVAAGLKTVENRSWNTIDRGSVLIHASGDPIWTLPDPKYLPNGALPVLSDWFDCMDWRGSHTYQHDGQYWRKGDDGRVYFSGGREAEPEFRWIDSMMRRIAGGNPACPSQAIIGSVEIIDVRENYDNIWAEKGCFHWVLGNAKTLEKPIIHVMGKLRLWEYQGRVEL